MSCPNVQPTHNSVSRPIYTFVHVTVMGLSPEAWHSRLAAEAPAGEDTTDAADEDEDAVDFLPRITGGAGNISTEAIEWLQYLSSTLLLLVLIHVK